MTGTHDIDDRAAHAQAVVQLVLRERHSRDRGWWDDMASCFTPDVVIDMSWFTGPASEFMRRTRERSANEVWGRHRLSPPMVRVTGDRAWAELPLGIEFRTTVNDVEADLVSYARSQYRAERRDGEWRIARITSIYERDTLTPAIPGTALGLDPADFAAFRPSYRCLAWYFSQAGAPLGRDLLGDDRPDEVAHHYVTERAWLLARLRSSRAMAAKSAQCPTPCWRPSPPSASVDLAPRLSDRASVGSWFLMDPAAAKLDRRHLQQPDPLRRGRQGRALRGPGTARHPGQRDPHRPAPPPLLTPARAGLVSTRPASAAMPVRGAPGSRHRPFGTIKIISPNGRVVPGDRNPRPWRRGGAERRGTRLPSDPG
jgi:hypothetical protein